MKKSFFVTTLVVMLVVSLATTAQATEVQNPYELPYDVTSGEEFEACVSTSIGNGVARTDLGMGKLYHSDPLIGYPKAYAYTEAYSTSYKVRAKCDVNSNGERTASTGWSEMNNTKACNSGTIQASSAKCVFDGFHEIQTTSTSAVGVAQTSYSYS